MEHISNETKAREIAKKLSHPNIDSFGDGDDEFDSRFYHVCKDAALQAMRWKDEQHEQQKQQLIDKACEFWEHKFPYTCLIDTIKEFVDTIRES